MKLKELNRELKEIDELSLTSIKNEVVIYSLIMLKKLVKISKLLQ